jgi:hypothetical protein
MRQHVVPLQNVALLCSVRQGLIVLALHWQHTPQLGSEQLMSQHVVPLQNFALLCSVMQGLIVLALHWQHTPHLGSEQLMRQHVVPLQNVALLCSVRQGPHNGAYLSQPIGAIAEFCVLVFGVRCPFRVIVQSNVSARLTAFVTLKRRSAQHFVWECLFVVQKIKLRDSPLIVSTLLTSEMRCSTETTKSWARV